MERLRAAAINVAERVARSRPGDPENERGQGLAEYALILAGIAIVAITSLIFLGGNITAMFWNPISQEFGDVLCNVLGICP
jgi:Flp pilus assembly pilin Flp